MWNPSYFNYNTNLVDDAMISGYRNLAWSPLGGNPVGGLNRLFTRKGMLSTSTQYAAHLCEPSSTFAINCCMG